MGQSMWQDLKRWKALHLQVQSMIWLIIPDQLRCYVYKQTLKHDDVLVGKLKSGLIEIFNRDFDVGGEAIEFYDDDDDDDEVVVA